MSAAGLHHYAMRRFCASALRAAALAACCLVIAAGAITFGFFYATTPTRWFNVRATELIAWRNTLVLPYPFGNGTTGRTTPLLSGTISFLLIWQWCGTLAVALGSAGLLWLSSGGSLSPNLSASASTSPKSPSDQEKNGARGNRLKSVASAAKKGATRCRRLLGWRVPPRGLWRWLLGPGGLTLLNLLLILLWFGLHIMWMHEMTMRVLDNRRMPRPPPKVAAKAQPPVSKSQAPINKASPASTTAAPTTSTPAGNPNATRGVVRRLMQASTSVSPSSSPSSSRPASQSPGPSRTKAAPPPPAKKVKSLPEVVEDSLAKYFGWVGRLDILLLFFPLARCNFLHWLLGSDFPALVKYHRWLGHGTLLVYSLHGIIYMVIWSHDGVLRTMLFWGMEAGVNRLSGLISLCGGWMLWVTAVPLIRRKLFNLFYGCHILGAVIFMLFGFMHRKDVATWVMPGVLLYLLDVVLRTIQQNFNCVRLSAAADDPACAATATVSPEGHVLSLSVRCHESLRWMGGETVFLNVPAISWWQWHPFTLASAPSDCPRAGDQRMELRIKGYNRWTKALISRLSNPKASPVNLYVSGPYGSGNRKWMTAYGTHVFVAGGIGATPAMGMIQQLIAARTTGRVILIWVSRTMDELKALPYEILREASASSRASAEGPSLDLRLFLTAGGSAAKAPPPPEPPASETTSSRCSNDADGGATKCSASSGSSDAEGTTTTPSSPAAAAAPRASSDKYAPGAMEAACTTCARPLSHPYMFSPGLWMVAAVLCFGGAFTGLICAQSYDAYMARTVATRKDFSYVGMLQFAALGVGAVLPPAVLFLALHLYRRLRPRSMSPLYPPSFGTSAGRDSSRWGFSDMGSPAKDSVDSRTAADSPTKKSPSPVAALESYITYGRPDLAAMLKQLALTGDVASSEDADAVVESVEGLRVGVFAAGPGPLVGCVADVCASLNGVWGRSGRAFLDFEELTFEL